VLEELVEARAVAQRHVVDLVGGLWMLRGGGQQVGLDRVGDVAEVPAGLAVAVTVDGLPSDHRRNPLGDDGRIGTFGILLARTEDVEVARRRGLEERAG